VVSSTQKAGYFFISCITTSFSRRFCSMELYSITVGMHETFVHTTHSNTTHI